MLSFHRKLQKWFLLLFLLAVGLGLAASMISYAIFGAGDPYDTAAGLYRVLFTDAPYAEIQQDPRIILAKPTASLDAYMAERGYTQDTSQQLGALLTYTNGEREEIIVCAVNSRLAQWRWQE